MSRMSRDNHQGTPFLSPVSFRWKLRYRANDVRRYDVQCGSIITVRQITFHLEILPVRLVRRPGKTICRWERQHVRIEIGEGARINNEEVGEVSRLRRMGEVLRKLRLV